MRPLTMGWKAMTNKKSIGTQPAKAEEVQTGKPAPKELSVEDLEQVTGGTNKSPFLITDENGNVINTTHGEDPDITPNQIW